MQNAVLLLLCLWGLTAFCVGFKQVIVQRPHNKFGRGRCAECGYDLAGLAPEAQCPECGRPDASVGFKAVKELRIREDRHARLYACATIAFTVLIASVSTSSLADELWLRLHHFSPITSANFARANPELAFLMAFGAAISPLAARARNRRRAIAIMLIMCLTTPLALWTVWKAQLLWIDLHAPGITPTP